MNRKTSTALFSVVLFASFFMPFFTWQSDELNGFNFIVSDQTPAYKYLLCLIPALTLVRISGALVNEHSLLIRKLLSWLPLAILGFLLVVIFINPNTGNSDFVKGSIFTNTGSGFWLALSLSLLLCFNRPRPQHQY